jgi:transposase-like protein
MRTTTAASEPIQSVPVTMDTKGRVRTSKEQRCDILAAFERRGVSAVEFAKENGIKYSTFAGWLQRHRRAKPKGQPPIMRLLEAVVEQTQGGAASSVSSVALRLPGGTQIELADPKQVPLVAALLRALAQPC